MNWFSHDVLAQRLGSDVSYAVDDLSDIVGKHIGANSALVIRRAHGVKGAFSLACYGPRGLNASSTAA